MNIIETNFIFGALSNRSATTELYYHHVAGNMSASAIHAMHKNTNGWAGIGYHFVVDKDGKIYRGRPVGAIGAHATGYNSNSVAIVFNGNFESEKMSEAQKQAGKELTTYILSLYPTIKTIRRHKDVAATACPGSNFPFDEIKKGSGASTSTNADAAVTHKVVSGDTLSALAKRYSTTVDKIVSLNKSKYKNITSSYIQTGWVLQVGGTYSMYTVKSGDTLTKIASGNGTTVSVIMSINPAITNADKISVGQQIKLP